MRILLCDDNRDELAEVSALLEEYFSGTAEELSLFCFDSPDKALDYLESGSRVDAAILDIVMPGMTGIELAERFRAHGFAGYIVFLTTANDYAAQSYSLNAFSYLLKPAALPAVGGVMDKLLEDRKKTDDESFTVKKRTELLRIPFKELIYAEVISHNLHFHLDGGRVVTVYASMKEYAGVLLENERMLRANKSFIVNIDYISGMDSRGVVMRDDARISVTGGFTEFKNACYRRMFGKGS